MHESAFEIKFKFNFILYWRIKTKFCTNIIHSSVMHYVKGFYD